MVQDDTLSQATRQDSSDDGLPPLEIEDSTTSETLRAEAEFFGEEPPIQDAGLADAGTPELVEPGTATPTAPPIAQPEQVQEAPPPPPQERTFSQEEWRKMQSAYDRQIAELNKQQQELKAFQEKQQVETQVEAELRRQEQQLSDRYGEEEARRYVRSTDNVNSVRDALEARAEVARVRNEAQEYKTQSRTVVMNNWVGELARRHALSPDSQQALAQLVNPVVLQDDNAFMATGNALSTMAARLADSDVRAAQLKSIVPRETSETALESGQSSAPAPPNDDAIAQAIMDKPSWEWTDQEAAFIRRRSG